MSKRVLDVVLAATGLVILGPLLILLMVLVWLQDGRSPLYVADRAGRHGRVFKIVKLRSMRVGADKSGVESTGASDPRITPLGRLIRRWKLDELPQLWNVVRGDMSLVGPRPNTLTASAAYSDRERHLLQVRPGITDFASIVFSDEGEIIKHAVDPDRAYDELIRPWKSRLGLLYARRPTLILDLKLLVLAIATMINKQRALERVVAELARLGAEEDLIDICRRDRALEPAPHESRI